MTTIKKVEKKKQVKARFWCFTLNNPTTCDIMTSTVQVKLLVATLEVGDSGTPHYQGYLELTNNRNLSQVKNLFVSETVHLERRQGSRQQALQYVLKTLTEEQRTLIGSLSCATISILTSSLPTYEWNHLKLAPLIIIGFEDTFDKLVDLSQEKKTVKDRLKVLQKKIKNGEDNLAIADEDFELWVKYHRAFGHYALLCAKPRDFKTFVVVIQGPTGTGKSKYCMELDSDAYWKQRSNWWDGYQGQPTCIIDEFYGWLPYDLLLRLTDRYPLSVEIKGGSVNFCSKTLVITSNKHPENWYSNVYFPAFIRRVDKWITMSNTETIEYTNYNEVIFINF